MTNVEASKRDAEIVESFMVQMSDNKCWSYCDCCVYQFKNCLRNCETGVKEWIRQEVEEDE